MEQTSQNTPNKFLIPLAIVVAGGLVSAAIYFGGSSGSQVAQVGSANNPTAGPIEIAPVTAKDHIVGSRSAELVIVEYSDTECPFCKVFHNTLKEVVDSYDGKVAWVYRHFPISQLHSKAPKEAEATECAYELGGNQAFWNYINRLFEVTTSNDSLDPSELPKIASATGLDVTKFNACLSTGRYSATIQKNVEDAVKTGARGTPYSVLVTRSGEKVAIIGAEPIASVKSKIDALLNK